MKKWMWFTILLLSGVVVVTLVILANVMPGHQEGFTGVGALAVLCGMAALHNLEDEV